MLLLTIIVSLSAFNCAEAKGNCSEKLEITNHSQISTNEEFNLRSIKPPPSLISGIPSNNLEAFMSTVEIIISRGYHAEMHPVTTDDDYILMLHRIPYPKGRNSGPTGQPVFILHGIPDSSADWVLLPTDKSLAFSLADLGYDVWLGNYRGNTYSRGHVTFDSSHDKAYWDFSFDEMGRYDIPAVINHVLNVTGRAKLSYIGYSMGTTAFFVCMHYHPELNDKIELMAAMAPVTTFGHIKANARHLVPFRRFIQIFLWIFEGEVFSSQKSLSTILVKKFCRMNRHFAILCNNAMFFAVGADYGNLDANMINVIENHNPAGTSVRSVAHLAQNIILDWNLRPQFNQYSYGWAGNLKHYGHINPPAYDLSKVTAPVYIFHALNDYLASPKDVEWTASRLSNVKKVVLVNHTSFHHIDFVFHSRAKELVYNQIIELLPPT